MAKKKKRERTMEADETIEKTIDPYTGELKPVPEDADQFIEVVPEETNNREGSNYLLNEESSMDHYAADANADAVAEEAAHYTEDEDIKKDFAERQNLAAGGREDLKEELDEHHSLSPRLTAGDVDASWQTAYVAGEETPGATVPTPDQDIVDDLGAAAGLTYEDDEPLDSDKKILDRDRNRWEMNPASARNEEDEEFDDGDFEDDEDLEDELEDEDLEEDDEEDDEEEDLDELGYELEDEDELDVEIEDEEEDDR